MTASPRKFLITGATSGIGLAISQRLLREGHRVVALGRDFRHLDAQGETQKRGLTEVSLDLLPLEQLPEQLNALSKAHCDIDGIICCAGQGQFGSLEEFSYQQIRELMDLNFTSQAFISRAFLPHLKRKKRGELIFIGSESALSGGRRGAIYSASKFALRGMAQALRDECSRSQVRVCLINPGMVNTAFFDDLNFAPGEDKNNYIEPEDVAEAVSMVINARAGTVVDEINLSPLKKVIQFKKG
ncbi:MAG TPA: SDR family NAD(P)-dependent oxidoreductase [Candidatus Tenderia sp.]|nr:SDR family NAD(P)-dependent oxidoreductase [Candidatus Tenderia sp.]